MRSRSVWLSHVTAPKGECSHFTDHVDRWKSMSSRNHLIKVLICSNTNGRRWNHLHRMSSKKKVNSMLHSGLPSSLVYQCLLNPPTTSLWLGMYVSGFQLTTTPECLSKCSEMTACLKQPVFIKFYPLLPSADGAFHKSSGAKGNARFPPSGSTGTLFKRNG